MDLSVVHSESCGWARARRGRTVSVGSRLHEIRSGRKISLRALAHAAGLTASFLSQVERDLAVPSIPSLRAIAQALGVPVFTFFVEEPEGAAAPGVVVHPSERRVMTVPGSGQQYELLTPQLARRIGMMLLSLAPGSETAPEPLAHAGEEGVFVVSGEVRLELGGEVHRLREGDSAYYPSDTPHRYVNESDRPCRVLFCMTPPA